MCSSIGEQVSAGTYLTATLRAAGSERMSRTRDSLPYPMNSALPRYRRPGAGCPLTTRSRLGDAQFVNVKSDMNR